MRSSSADSIQDLAAAAEAAQAASEGPIFGHLALGGARRRDVFLGPRTVLPRGGDGVAVLDWQRAPLAEVFFGAAEGEEYEVEAEGRSLRGVLVARHHLEWAGPRVSAVVGAGQRWRRSAAGWVQEDLPAWGWGARLEGAVAPAGAEVTLDPTQRAAAETGQGQAVLLLGEAGFGKTTVALHRVAQLARSARARGEGHAALVVVPTEGLRRLAALMLARMEVPEARVVTYDAWALAEARRAFKGLPRRDAVDTPAPVVTLKRQGGLRAVLPEVAARPGAPRRSPDRQDLLHLFGDRALLDRAGASPAAVAATLEHTHVQFSVTTEEAFAHVDADRLEALDGRRLDEGTPWEDAESLDAEDAAVLFALQRLRWPSAPGPRRYDHVVVDEAQELAPLELALVGRARARGGALTVAGDARQHTDETGTFEGWPAALAELGAPEAATVTLTESYRCPPAVEALARGLFVSGPQVPDGPSLRRACLPDPCRLEAELLAQLDDFTRHNPQASVAVVYRSRAEAAAAAQRLARSIGVHLALDGDFHFGPGVNVTCVEEVKGLEFDLVVVPDATPGRYPGDDPLARRALYVAFTRAVHALWVLAAGRWTPMLPTAC